MNKLLSLPLLIIAILISGCQDKSPQGTDGIGQEVGLTPPYTGKVTFTKTVGTYTYVEIETGGQKVWAAGPQVSVKAGDTVSTGGGSMMNNFESKGLNRTFESILFTDVINVNSVGQAPGTQKAASTEPVAKPANAEAPEKGSIQKAEGGYTLAEIIEKKEELKGKNVTFRGKIVKANLNIMGTHWYHVQDGTGNDNNIDLLMTSQQEAAAGTIVLAKGVLNLNKDLGSGYKFDIIVEETEIKAE